MNNSKIAKALFFCASTTTPEESITSKAKEIISAHNYAAHYGFIDLPYLVFVDVELGEDKIMVTVQPHAGIININDLYLLKQMWGADDLNVDKEGIELVFKK